MVDRFKQLKSWLRDMPMANSVPASSYVAQLNIALKGMKELQSTISHLQNELLTSQELAAKLEGERDAAGYKFVRIKAALDTYRMGYLVLNALPDAIERIINDDEDPEPEKELPHD